MENMAFEREEGWSEEDLEMSMSSCGGSGKTSVAGEKKSMKERESGSVSLAFTVEAESDEDLRDEAWEFKGRRRLASFRPMSINSFEALRMSSTTFSISPMYVMVPAAHRN